ncbi:MAG: preprotein translocase subunit SecG [Candidatus Sungbacteria bacterium]|nr:preprotein translocase subunit SecG [Candidatus Sungbacteria bacterium]
MDISRILTIFQVIVSLLLIGAILLQQRGEGLSQTFGGSGGGAYRTRRGLENILFWATIVLAALFLASATASILL